MTVDIYFLARVSRRNKKEKEGKERGRTIRVAQTTTIKNKTKQHLFFAQNRIQCYLSRKSSGRTTKELFKTYYSYPCPRRTLYPITLPLIGFARIF